MIVKEEFLTKLRQYFGLNLYEVKIWSALLSRGVSTAGELSDIGNVPRSRAYDVLESLEKKGFVTMKLGKPMKYIAVEPEEVIERVKKSIKKEAEESINQLKGLTESGVLDELNQLHTVGIEYIEPTDLSGIVRGRSNIYSHLDYMIRNAEKSVTIMTTSGGVLRKLKELAPVFERLNRKKVKIRIAAPLTKETAAELRLMSGAVDLKHANTFDARFCIVDGKNLLFMLMDDKKVHPSYDTGVWVTAPYFVGALEGLFDNHWKNLPSIPPKA